MARRISQSIVPTTEDVNALRDALAVRGPHDPVIAELRAPISILMLQMVIRASIDKLRIVSPAYSTK